MEVNEEFMPCFVEVGRILETLTYEGRTNRGPLTRPNQPVLRSDRRALMITNVSNVFSGLNILRSKMDESNGSTHRAED
jgi:hypothetical protein